MHPRPASVVAVALGSLLVGCSSPKAAEQNAADASSALSDSAQASSSSPSSPPSSSPPSPPSSGAPSGTVDGPPVAPQPENTLEQTNAANKKSVPPTGARERSSGCSRSSCARSGSNRRRTPLSSKRRAGRGGDGPRLRDPRRACPRCHGPEQIDPVCRVRSLDAKLVQVGGSDDTFYAPSRYFPSVYVASVYVPSGNAPSEYLPYKKRGQLSGQHPVGPGPVRGPGRGGG